MIFNYMDAEHVPREKDMCSGKVDFRAQKSILSLIPKNQNPPMKGFQVRTLFLTCPYEKTTSLCLK